MTLDNLDIQTHFTSLRSCGSNSVLNQPSRGGKKEKSESRVAPAPLEKVLACLPGLPVPVPGLRTTQDPRANLPWKFCICDRPTVLAALPRSALQPVVAVVRRPSLTTLRDAQSHPNCRQIGYTLSDHTHTLTLVSIRTGKLSTVQKFNRGNPGLLFLERIRKKETRRQEKHELPCP